ncbi:MAG: hypothetical protein EOO38_04785 [Cytophagaceae bacterium]|nr:MAG: hypothetical protein EOO38_04785 [Cytophagaceae bacterium]
MTIVKALSILWMCSTALGIPQRAQKPARLSISPPKQDSSAPDGSIIVDKQVVIDGLTLRYKVSAPAPSLSSNSSTHMDSIATKLGINLLLHGDGGASFEAFPNKIVQDNLMGVVLLAPNDALLWCVFLLKAHRTRT